MLALTTQLAEYLALHSKSCAFLTTFPSNRQVVLLVTGGTACHWWYCLSQMVLLVTGGTACHWWYCLLLVVLPVTGGTACHWCYCLSLVVLLVTGTACHWWYCLPLLVTGGVHYRVGFTTQTIVVLSHCSSHLSSSRSMCRYSV